MQLSTLVNIFHIMKIDVSYLYIYIYLSRDYNKSNINPKQNGVSIFLYTLSQSYSNIINNVFSTENVNEIFVLNSGAQCCKS